MNKFKSKKGFTLAELLIVVAIIAVLIAIAVPLFVGALSKAQEARDNANARSIKSAAEVFLLNNVNDATYWPADTLDEDGSVTATVLGWEVSGKVLEGGAIELTAITAKTGAPGTAVTATTPYAVTWSGDKCTIVGILLVKSDVLTLKSGE